MSIRMQQENRSCRRKLHRQYELSSGAGRSIGRLAGKNAYIEGYRIGGKTATSETLPRSANQYISSFIGFAPADDPQVLALCVINKPQGVYYGGTIAAPVVKEIFENILPYLGLEKAAAETRKSGHFLANS